MPRNCRPCSSTPSTSAVNVLDVQNGRGIRPLLRASLLIADIAMVAASVAIAPFAGDIHTATLLQLVVIGTILLLTGSYVQFRFESARTFDFHDVMRLVIGASAG